MAGKPIVKQPAKTGLKLNVPQSFIKSIANVELEGGFGTSSPYVQFVHHQAKNYRKLLTEIKGLSNLDVVLNTPGQLAVKLDPCVFTVFNMYQYWAVLDTQGIPTKVYWKLEDSTEDSKEHIDTIVIVYLDDRAVIARMLFKTTKVKAIRTAHAALLEASDDELWASKGNEYKNTLTVEQPMLRFIATIEMTQRTGKGSGNNYQQATADIEPTTSTEWKKVFDMFQEEDYEKNLQLVMNDFEARRKFLESKS